MHNIKHVSTVATVSTCFRIAHVIGVLVRWNHALEKQTEKCGYRGYIATPNGIKTKKGSRMADVNRVVLTSSARSRFPDLGTRAGALTRRSGDWAIVQWHGVEGETWIPAIDIEPETAA